MYLLPRPKHITYFDGSLPLSYGCYLAVAPKCCERLKGQGMLACDMLKEGFGFLPLYTIGECGKGDICLEQDRSDEEEGYRLVIGTDGVLLTGGGAGIWYGLQTLRQIAAQCGPLLPCLVIEDEPDFKNRGFYHDVSRGRIPTLAFLKGLVDQMAAYKLNQLQLYIEHTYLFRGMEELWRDDTPLTAREIRELDQYCMERGVELVPSLSSFGHLYKLLSSPKYAPLCELEDAADHPISLMGRMQHHTIDATNPEGIRLIKRMILEYMPLFTSKYFNICADETFDLGKGRNREYAAEHGIARLYMNYVGELCRFVVEHGRIPMFWGDIITDFPELIHELPEETICLNWGYTADVSEEPTRRLSEAGANQYNCSGTNGWNDFIYRLPTSYQNIRRMSAYARTYGSVGLLNTDWGDFLHVCHPEHGLVGLIYGAACAWNEEVPEFEEINREISLLAYADRSGRFVNLLAGVEKASVFPFDLAARYQELKTIEDFKEKHMSRLEQARERMAGVEEAIQELMRIRLGLYEVISSVPPGHRDMFKSYLVALDGTELFDLVGAVVYTREFGQQHETLEHGEDLARRLEDWLYHYKEVYRGISKEGELGHLQEVVLWYADYVREG